MLRQRIVTGILGAALVLAMNWLGGVYLAVLFAAIAAFSMLEIGSMMKAKTFSAETIIAVLFSALIVLWPSFERFWYILFYLLLILTIFRRKEFSFAAAGVLFAGALYSSYAFRSLLSVRHLQSGVFFVLIILLAIWSTDTGAFFVGRAFGGRKLMPEVSPKKTVSGALGGLILAVIVTMVAGSLFVHFSPSRLWRYALLGLVVSIAGQLGDLIESALKRHYAVKDSGWILPGHGGVLDRFDSLLLAAPIAYHLILWMFFST